jgi:hypothetical protein
LTSPVLGLRALLSEDELRRLHERLVGARPAYGDLAGAQLAVDRIEALRSGGVLPPEDAAAHAVHVVLGRDTSDQSAGLARLRELLHAELTRPSLRLA